MRVSDFHFDLPEELIAQVPLPRGASRMLVLDRIGGAFRDDRFANLLHLLRAGDLLILNDSRVIPARLYATRAGHEGRIEVLLTQQLSENVWFALVRPGRKVHPGTILHFAAPGDPYPLLNAEVISEDSFGERTLRFAPTPNFHDILNKIGHIPLPPYIHRDDAPEDRERYQTIYAARPGSAAAPTAGLHFTQEILNQLEVKGIQVETITLHVGLGTFQPVRAENLQNIRLHAEHYTLSPQTATAISMAISQKRRIIAVGTTTTRTLEHCARLSPGDLEPHSGQTNIFIAPGHEFRIVSGLLTNFHLPQSTLLMLVSAFAGREAVLTAYAHAVADQYRFFSYGDCMLIL